MDIRYGQFDWSEFHRSQLHSAIDGHIHHVNHYSIIRPIFCGRSDYIRFASKPILYVGSFCVSWYVSTDILSIFNSMVFVYHLQGIIQILFIYWNREKIILLRKMLESIFNRKNGYGPAKDSVYKCAVLFLLDWYSNGEYCMSPNRMKIEIFQG